MVVIGENQKDGKGNNFWQKALAEVTSDQVFKDTREAVLKMMEEAKVLQRSSSRIKPKSQRKARNAKSSTKKSVSS